MWLHNIHDLEHVHQKLFKTHINMSWIGINDIHLKAGIFFSGSQNLHCIAHAGWGQDKIKTSGNKVGKSNNSSLDL